MRQKLDTTCRVLPFKPTQQVKQNNEQFLLSINGELQEISTLLTHNSAENDEEKQIFQAWQDYFQGITCFLHQMVGKSQLLLSDSANSED